MNLRVFGFITWAVVRYTLRDHIAAFFMLFLPFAIIVLVGIVLNAGASHPLGIVSYDNGRFAGQLTTELSQDKAIKVDRFATLGQLRTAVREQQVRGDYLGGPHAARRWTDGTVPGGERGELLPKRSLGAPIFLQWTRCKS